ncbi:DNA cytosine methyltransferase [Bdellovibrio sp. HCB-162]|uniref:DNA cytosine methyltransferase n=1 Tax=Bdellovibrio sp. HCB-162 TaxID=3394234 RepID=UPI0039BC3C7A
MKSYQSRFTSIDLFSGCGGLTLGLKKAGFNVLAAVEIDDLAAETYRVNHKSTKLLHQDIRTIDPAVLRKELRLRRGELGLIAGCPPCQGFSTLRTRKKNVSVRDDRNNLMFNFLDFVSEFLPKTVMMENVPGLAKGKRLAKFISELNGMGYQVRYDVLDVAKFGVPQRRKRFILLASRVGNLIFADPASKKVVVSDVLKGIEKPEKSKDPAHNHGEKRSPKVQKIVSLIPLDGGSRSALPKKLLMDCHKRTNGFNDVYGRMKWNDVAPTITGGCVEPSKGRFLHPMENRAITIREAALIQTFPKNYFFSMKRGKTGAALMVGNALPPEFIRRQALQIKRLISKE